MLSHLASDRFEYLEKPQIMIKFVFIPTCTAIQNGNLLIKSPRYMSLYYPFLIYETGSALTMSFVSEGKELGMKARSTYEET